MAETRGLSKLFYAHLAVLASYLLFFLFLTNTYRPDPVSDFGQYWFNIGNFASYYKGGIFPFLYWPFKELGLPPYLCAFFVNSICWVLLGFSLWLSPYDRKTNYLQAGASCVLLCLGMWYAGMSPLVNADLPHISIVSLGLYFLFRYSAISEKNSYLIIAAVLLALGFTIRMQGILTFAIVLSLFVLIYLFKYGSIRSLLSQKIIVVIVISLCAAVFLESGFRLYSDDDMNKSRYSRTSLYAGLLLAQPGWYCGFWTEKAYNVSVKEINKPLFEVLRLHLSKKTPGEIAKIIGVKMIHFLSFSRFSFVWLHYSVEQTSLLKDSEAINKGAMLKKINGAKRYNTAERTASWGLKIAWIVLFLFGVTNPMTRRNFPWFALSVLIFSSYLMVHAVFEIQNRYMAPQMAFALLAFLYSHRPPSGFGERDRKS